MIKSGQDAVDKPNRINREKNANPAFRWPFSLVTASRGDLISRSKALIFLSYDRS